MKLTRRRTICCLILGLMLLAVGAFQLFLRSGSVRRIVLAAISQFYAGSVELERVSVGWRGGIVLKNVRLHRTDSGQSPIVCEVPRVEILASVPDLLRGQFKPTRVVIKKPLLRLEQTPDGRLDLDLPISNPPGGSQFDVPVQIVDARLQIESASKQATARRLLSGIFLDLSLSESGQLVAVSGRVNDPLWERWQFRASARPKDSEATVSFETSTLTARPEHAAWLGSRANVLWNTVQPNGRVAVRGEVSWDRSRGLRYEILVDPQNIALRVPTIAEQVSDLTGRVEITPTHVRIHGLTGRFAKGEVVASGTITRDAELKIAMNAEVRRLSVEKLAGERFREFVAPMDSLTGKLGLAGAADPATWAGKFDGLLSLRDGSEPLPVHLSIADSSVRVNDFAFRWAGGDIKVQAVAPLAKDGVATGSVTLRGVDLALLYRALGEQGDDVEGVATADLRFQVVCSAWSDPNAWKWDGPFDLRRARFDLLEFGMLQGILSCRNRTLTIVDGAAVLEGRPMRGSLSLELFDPYKLSAKFVLVPFDLRELAPDDRSDPPLYAGQFEARGTAEGTLKPAAFNVAGDGFVRSLQVLGRSLGNISLRYNLNGDGFDFRDAQVAAFGGRLRTHGRWSWVRAPRDREDKAAGPSLRIEGDYENVEISEVLAGDLPEKYRLYGRANGRVVIDLPFSESAKRLQVASQLDAATLWVAGVFTENARAEIRWVDNALSIPKWSGKIAAGQVTGSARVQYDGHSPQLSAKIASSRLDLESLIAIFSRETDSAVRGAVAGDLNVQFLLADGSVRATGSGQVAPLLINDLPVIDSVAIREVRFEGNRIYLDGCRASVLGGTAAGSAIVDLRDEATKIVEVTLDRVEQVELARTMKTWPVTWSRPRGQLSGSGRFYVKADSSHGLAATGNFELGSASIFDFPVSHAEGTIEVRPLLGPASGNSSSSSDETPAVLTHKAWITIKDSRTARGGLQGQVLLTFGDPLIYETRLYGASLDLAMVAQALFGNSYQVAGNISGELHLRGSSRGVADMNGEIVWLQLGRANLWPYPLFAVIAKMLKPSLTQSGAFHTGEVRRAAIRGGVVDFREGFWLAGDAVQLFGQGTVSPDGRIDLSVVGNVETGLARSMPVFGPLQKALSYLQQRLVKIHLTGTLADPVAVPVPLQDLSEPAIKFFRGVITGTLFDEERNDRPIRR